MKETKEHFLSNGDPKKIAHYGSSRSKASDQSTTSLTTSDCSGDSEGVLKRSFKEKKTFGQRRVESQSIKARFPTKIAVIVERYEEEKYLPTLGKTKFLVPHELTISQFQQIIRERMQLSNEQTIYLLINGKTMPSMSSTVGQIYAKEKDDDGFLYFTYASEDFFG